MRGENRQYKTHTESAGTHFFTPSQFLDVFLRCCHKLLTSHLNCKELIREAASYSGNCFFYSLFMISMDLVIVVALVVLQVSLQPSLAALFTVEAEHTSYNSEYGGNVVMGCRFSSKPANSQNDLKVIWHWMDGSPDQEVIRLVGNLESSSSSKFKGRVKLLTDELKNSWAKIQISNLRITDSGTYQCLVQTTEGTDYKTIALSVGAPYHSVSKQIERTAEGDKVVLTCQSEGYPQSPVVWQDGHLQSYSSNTTTTTTPDGLIKVVSQIEVSSSEKTKYTCNFTKDHSSATFHIPDDIPLRQGENDILIVVLCVGLVLTAIGLGVVIYRRRKDIRTPRTHSCLAGDVESMSAAACLQKDKGNEVEEIVVSEEENLRSHLKARYSEFYLTTKKRDASVIVSLPYRLQNKEGMSVRLQDLLANTGEVLLPEGGTSWKWENNRS